MAGTRKRASEKTSNIVQWVIPTAVLFLYLVITLLNYSSAMRENATESVESMLTTSTTSLKDSFADELKATAQIAKTTAAALGVQDDVLSETSQTILKNAIATGKISGGYIADAEGNAVSAQGESYSIAGEQAFAVCMTNTPGYSDAYLDEATGEYCIAALSPIVKDGMVEGAVAMEYSIKNFEELPRTSEHDGRTLYFLTQKNGQILGFAGYRKDCRGQNMIELLSAQPKSDINVKKKLTQNMENGKSGNIPCVFAEEERMMSYQSVGINGLYIAELFTQRFVDQSFGREFKSTNSIFLKISVAMGLFFVLIILINIINKAVYSKQSKELQSKAETDLLTGLLNKIATEKHIEEYLEGEGKDHDAMLFVLDIDNFKKINDTMGHAFGDEVLSTLGQRIKSEFRLTDIVGRIGGDEFLVFLKDVKDDATRKREANRVSEFFKEFKAGEYVKYSATASIGAAIYPKDGLSFDELYKSADKAVYKAKQRGKNQLAFYGDEDAAEEKND